MPSAPDSGLSYDNETLEGLVNRDTDGDGIMDWEENLWGTDPAKKETTLGIADSLAIEKIKAEEGVGESGNFLQNITQINTENLTQTDQFSRELFATIVAANQAGTMDEAAIESLTTSLSEKIQNAPPRKVFSVFDIKTTTDNSAQSFTNYNKSLSDIYKKNPAVSYTILDVLQKFIIDENSVDASALVKLEPIIKQTNNIITAMLKINAPQSIATLHLSVINSFQRLVENISDIKLYDSDAIMALGGISKYQENATRLETDLNNLAKTISQKLKN